MTEQGEGGGEAGAGRRGRRFVATASVDRRVWIGLAAGQIAFVVGTVVLSRLAPERVAATVVPLVLLLGVGVYVSRVAGRTRPRSIPIDLEPGRVVVDEGRVGAFPVARAVIGPWRLPHLGVVSGTVLHLDDGARSYRIAGHDVRPDAGVPERAAPVQTIDAALGAADFTALLDAIGLGAPAGATTPPVRVVTLAPNPASPATILGKIAPWLVTMGVLAVTAATIEPLLARAGLRPVGAALLFVIAVTGLAVTARRAMRTAPAMTLRLGPDGLAVIDPRGRSVAAAPLASVASRAGWARFQSRGTTFDYPSLAIDLGGRASIHVGVYDARFLWVGGAPRGPAPRYIAGAPDWIALATALGHGARVPDPAADHVPS